MKDRGSHAEEAGPLPSFARRVVNDIFVRALFGRWVVSGEDEDEAIEVPLRMAVCSLMVYHAFWVEGSPEWEWTVGEWLDALYMNRRKGWVNGL